MAQESSMLHMQWCEVITYWGIIILNIKSITLQSCIIWSGIYILQKYLSVLLAVYSVVWWLWNADWLHSHFSINSDNNHRIPEKDMQWQDRKSGTHCAFWFTDKQCADVRCVLFHKLLVTLPQIIALWDKASMLKLSAVLTGPTT